MLAYVIDPSEETMSKTDLPNLTCEIRRLFDGAALKRVETLPSGDGVYLVLSDIYAGMFRLGRTRRYRGLGLVLGRRGAYGLFGDVTTDFDGLAAILKFGRGPAARATEGIQG